MEEGSFSIETLFDFLSRKQPAISIVGTDKNIGKTTLLNYLLKGMNERGFPSLVLSIGRDGESEDSIEKTEKPRIKVYKGGFFLSLDVLISQSVAVEILESFEERVSGSNIILGRALQDTYVQLINPGSVDRVKRLIASCKKKFNTGTVFIDGALDRVSHASNELVDGVFICAGAQSDGSIDEIMDETAFLVQNLEKHECDSQTSQIIRSVGLNAGTLLIRKFEIIEEIPDTLLTLTAFEEKIENDDIIYTSGIVTDKIANRFFEIGVPLQIVLTDGTKIKFSVKCAKRLNRLGIEIRVLKRIPVYGLSLNSVGIRRSLNPSKLLRMFKQKFRNRMVFDTTFLD